MDTTPEAQRLCGREAEIEQLSRQMENVADGRPEVICLEGAGGIGKTSLMLAATALAHRRGFTVLSARAARLEREFSFGIVRQLLEPALFGASAGTRRALLHGPAALAGQVLDAPPSPEAPRADIPATFHALWWLLANLAQRAPVLVAVDDLHSADAPSAQWLAYVARRLRRHQIGVLTTLLDGAADDHLLDHSTAGSPVQHVQVRGLDLDATREVIEDALSGHVDPGFVSACHTVTDGNPALLVELLRTVPASGTAPNLDRFGPQELVAAVNTRLRNEDPALHVLARTLAALGDTSADLHVAAAVSGLPLAAAADAVHRLVQLNLLTDRPAPAFLHSIVQAAFACQLAPTEPGQAHARAAT